MDRAGRGRCAHRPGRRHPGRGDLAAGWPLPVAQHHRLGARDLLPIRQRAHAGAVQRHQRNPADLDRRLCALEQQQHLLPDLGLPDRVPGAVGEPARFARGPGDARAARRPGHDGEPGHQSVSREALHLRHRGTPVRAVRLALRAHEPLRQPRALRRQCRHPLSPDGDGGRHGLPLGRDRGRGHRHPAQEQHPGLAAGDLAGRLGPARGRRVLGAVHPAAAARARRHRALRAALAAARAAHPAPRRRARSNTGSSPNAASRS